MDIASTIAQIAAEEGIDPAYALAVAERESGFNPNARASRSIYGLFQMSGPLRAEYGVPYGAPVEQQVRGWAAFTRDLRDQLARRIGRQPSNAELYLAHYWGPGRAAAAIRGGDMPVNALFTPQELALNPELGRAGSVSRAASRILADIDRRAGKYGQPVDFSAFGQPSDELAQLGGPQETDFSKFGVADEPTQQSGANDQFANFGKPQETDFSKFGVANETAGPQAKPARPGTEITPAAFMQGIPSTDEWGDKFPHGMSADRTPQALMDESILPYPFIPADQPLPQPHDVSI